MRKSLLMAAALFAAAATQPIQAEGTEKIEEVLVEKWEFFKAGDVNRDGFMSETEFMDHGVYKSVGWKTGPKTFVFWMIDDNKDSKVSLQEWFNNELGQFQLGDKNHDGFIDKTEYVWMENLQEKLFKDLGYDN